jgi:hypothetical protein
MYQREEELVKHKRLTRFLKNIATQKDNKEILCNAHPRSPWWGGEAVAFISKQARQPPTNANLSVQMTGH